MIEEFAGVLPFDDKASPEVIQREFGLSKAAFKRAVGHLMKEKQVVIRDCKIWTAEKAKKEKIGHWTGSTSSPVSVFFVSDSR